MGCDNVRELRPRELRAVEVYLVGACGRAYDASASGNGEAAYWLIQGAKSMYDQYLVETGGQPTVDLVAALAVRGFFDSGVAAAMGMGPPPERAFDGFAIAPSVTAFGHNNEYS